MSATKTIYLIPIIILAGCAHSFKAKLVQNMALAGAAGAVAGAQNQSYKTTHAIMYAGLAAAAAAIFTTYYEDPDKELERLKSQTAMLRSQGDEFAAPSKEGSAIFGAKLPSKYQNLVNPGSWRIYDLDQWIEDDENRMIHQDKMMELIPPSLIPKSINKNRKDTE